MLPRHAIPAGLDPADCFGAIARLKPAACELAERPGDNDFIIANDISFQTTALVVWAALVTVAVEIDPVAGCARDLGQPIVLALARKGSVPTNVIGVALELGECGRGQENAPCEEPERSPGKPSHWVSAARFIFSTWFL